jgi:peptidoglycan/xylan/chitin deacetylase (PgdA/CDA1 family)
MSVKFLLRFDDMCPTINWDVWQKLEDVMVGEGVKPILSVIPDNQDPNLHECEPNERFWERVRVWQARGWTIGLHGYQHRYVSRNPGIVGLKPYSEFAGVPVEEQRAKLKQALEIFTREGVRPDCWVAPAHSFDENTVSILVSLGIRTISDGLTLYPHRDSQKVMWVPQQLWRFRAVPFGVWTICIHCKDDLYLDSNHFRRCIREYKHALTSLPEMVDAYSQRKSCWMDRAIGGLWHIAIRAKVAMAAAGAPAPEIILETTPEADARQRLKAVL